MKTLYLPIKRQFFDQIAAGIKTVEYREMKSYWINRLEGRMFDQVLFKAGYSRTAPKMRVKCKGIKKGTFQGKPYYEIQLGDIIEIL